MRDAATIVRGKSGQVPNPINHQTSNVASKKRTMKAIVVTDQAAGTAGMKLVERPKPPAAINDVIVQIHASGFVPTELSVVLDLDRSPRP